MPCVCTRITYYVHELKWRAFLDWCLWDALPVSSRNSVLNSWNWEQVGFGWMELRINNVQCTWLHKRIIKPSVFSVLEVLQSKWVRSVGAVVWFILLIFYWNLSSERLKEGFSPVRMVKWLSPWTLEFLKFLWNIVEFLWENFYPDITHSTFPGQNNKKNVILVEKFYFKLYRREHFDSTEKI